MIRTTRTFRIIRRSAPSGKVTNRGSTSRRIKGRCYIVPCSVLLNVSRSPVRALSPSLSGCLSLSRLLTKPLQPTSTEPAQCQARISRRRRSCTCLRKALRGVDLRTLLMRRQKDGASISCLLVHGQQVDIHIHRLVKRLDMRIIPASMIIYLLCFLDRSNIVRRALCFHYARGLKRE